MQTVCGTPMTMSPEIHNGEAYDSKCDIWSLGVIAFQLIYGRFPFPGNEGFKKLVEAICEKNIKLPTHPQVQRAFKG